MNIPKIEISEKPKRKGQSMAVVPISPKNPIRELAETISKDVATALFIGNSANKTKPE